MKPENITTLIKNKMTIEKWQEIYNSGMDLHDFKRENKKNYVMIIHL